MSAIQYLGNDEFKVSRKELAGLLKSEAILSALEWAGVDNWCGWDDARGDYVHEYVEEHEDMEAEDPWFDEIVAHKLKLIEEAEDK